MGYENFEPMPLSQFLADNDIKLVENSNESSVIIIDPVIFKQNEYEGIIITGYLKNNLNYPITHPRIEYTFYDA